MFPVYSCIEKNASDNILKSKENHKLEELHKERIDEINPETSPKKKEQGVKSSRRPKSGKSL